jgi:rhodanese-related sulfurtransferase
MSARLTISIVLAGIGLILAFLPFNAAKTFKLKPTELVEISANDDMYFTVDEVARFVNNEDSTIQLIDLRSKSEFMESNIPGSINIPYYDLLNPNWEGYLNQDKVRNVYYSNGDETANMAWTIISGLGYTNSFVMKGGMNEWYKTVMLSEFEGERITPRENALFENRFKARKTFKQINSLPDSLKTQYLEAKRLEESQLDGGC